MSLFRTLTPDSSTAIIVAWLCVTVLVISVSWVLRHKDHIRISIWKLLEITVGREQKPTSKRSPSLKKRQKPTKGELPPSGGSTPPPS